MGSGPAGVACAQALLERGADVLMLDVGRECEPERRLAAERLAGLAFENWPAQELARLREPRVGPSGVPLKRAFGSDFAYALDALGDVAQRGANCTLSYARGGLSNVWGAAALPVAATDIDDWPLGLEDLAEHYAAAARTMGLTGVRDELAELFPFYGEPAGPPRASRQASWVLERLASRRSALRSLGFTAGRSRLAVRGEGDGGCQAVGLCLTGCPHRAIYNSADTLERLRARPGFTYRKGVVVWKVQEGEDGAEVLARPDGPGAGAPASGDLLRIEARRVFLAAGPLGSSRIAAESRGFRLALPLKFQPYFLLPVLGLRGVGGVERERLHTLAQVFLELQDPRVSRRLVHLQLYTHNEVIAARFDALARHAWPLGIFRDAALGRLMAIQGYLHSDEAEPIRLVVHPNGSGPGRLELRAPDGAAVRRIVGRVLSRLLRAAPQTGLLPLPPLLTVGLAGDGNHIGCTFPMRSVPDSGAGAPASGGSDLLGRPAGARFLHLVDSTCLPSLPASTLTYTVMANAARIAARARALDEPAQLREAR